MDEPIIGMVVGTTQSSITVRTLSGEERTIQVHPRQGARSGAARLVVVANEDDPRWREVEGHAMNYLAPGVWYHNRLSTLFVIKSAARSANSLPITPLTE